MDNAHYTFHGVSTNKNIKWFSAFSSSHISNANQTMKYENVIMYSMITTQVIVHGCFGVFPFFIYLGEKRGEGEEALFRDGEKKKRKIRTERWTGIIKEIELGGLFLD